MIREKRDQAKAEDQKIASQSRANLERQICRRIGFGASSSLPSAEKFSATFVDKLISWAGLFARFLPSMAAKTTEVEEEEEEAEEFRVGHSPSLTSAKVRQQEESLLQHNWEMEQRFISGPFPSWSNSSEQRFGTTSTTTTGAGAEGDESNRGVEREEHQVSEDWTQSRIESESGLIGVSSTPETAHRRNEDRDGEDHEGSRQINRSSFVPTTPTIMNVNNPSRVGSEDSFSQRTERYYEWKRTRLGDGGGGVGPEGTIVRKPRLGDHEESLHNLSTMVDEDSDYFFCNKLPDHLIESVLARLPVQSVFRFRAVCRSWNSLLNSPTFVRAYLAAGEAIGHRQNVWFLVVTANVGRLGRYGHRIVATYDPQCNNWHRIPLPPPLCNLNPYPTAADGGLVCYFVYENRLRTLFVCNPLTKSLRKLPLVLKTSSHISVLKMVMEDRATSSYKVFVAGMVPGENGNDSLSMEIYDSATDRWSTSGIIPARYPKRRPVYGDGVLYVRCSDQRSLLLTYDLKAGVWNKIHAPLPHTLGIEELVHYQGHILLVGVLGENYKIDSVCIWELVQGQNPGNVAWKQVDSIPQDMFMEFFCDREYFECQEDDRVLMKCCQYGDLILCVAFSISHRGPFKVLAYDLAQKRWRRLPDSFKARECRTHKFIEGIIYEPRLDVVA